MDNKYSRHNRRKYSLKVHILLVTNIVNSYWEATLLTM